MDMRDAFFQRVVELAKLNDQIVFLTADHGAFALEEFESEMPERYINVGISEQNMIGVAAGLAASGKTVFAYGIAPFVSLRVMEQLTLDVAAMQLPVNVVSVGAGFTYSTDGPTHHGLQDLPAALTIPGLKILNSSDPVNTSAFAEHAVASRQPHYIRIEKGELPTLTLDEPFAVERGFSVVQKGGKTLLISSGSIIHEILLALPDIEHIIGDKATIVDLFAPSSVQQDQLKDLIRRADAVYSIEESYSRGIASILSYTIATNNLNVPLRAIAADFENVYFAGDRNYLRKATNLDATSICRFFSSQRA